MTAQRGPGGMVDRMVRFLQRRGVPASSAFLVEQFLKASVRSEEEATRLLAPSLQPAGIVYRPGEGWLLPGPPPESRTQLAAAVVAPGPGRVVIAPHEDPAGVILVLREPRLEAAPARAWLRARGLPQPAGVTSLRAAVRGAVRLPRNADLPGICAALGMRWLDGDDLGTILETMTGCLNAAAARRQGAAAPGADPGDDAPLPGRITREQIAALPGSAGTYRFLDAAGKILYVGKAANLNRRVAPYFKPNSAARRGGHGSRFLDRIDRLEVRPEGSELEALLRESVLIRRHAPEGNVQRVVHERGRLYGEARAWALLLPSVDGRRVTTVVVSGGRYLGAAPVAQRGGGSRKLRRLVGLAVCAAGRRRPAGRGSVDAGTEILSSWLARHGDDVSRLDLDVFTKASAAVTALRAAARALGIDRSRTLFR